jgi:hypothetical protein
LDGDCVEGALEVLVEGVGEGLGGAGMFGEAGAEGGGCFDDVGDLGCQDGVAFAD